MKNKSLITVMARIIVIFMVVAIVLIGNAVGEISRTGLVGEWHFDGNTKDSSGNGNDGVVHGVTFVDGKFGKALSFNGVDNYVSVGITNFPIGTGPRTIEAWVKTSMSGLGEIFSYGKGNNSQAFTVGIWGSSIFVSSWASPQYSVNVSVNNGLWHQVLVTFDGTNTYTYLDDAILDTRNFIINTGSGTANIGARILPTEFFNGIIDEVRIYNRALSADEVKAIYEAGQIIVTSSPSGSEVVVDGLTKGNASPTLTVSGIAPGSHLVKCKLSGYSDNDTNVVLTSSSVASVNCALSPAQTPTLTPTSTPTITPTPTSTLSPTPTVTATTPTLSTPKSASITGKVLDAKTGEPVQGATISMDGRSAATDSNGEYDLTVEAGKHSMNVSKQGYEPLTRSIIVSETGTMLDISLKSTSGEQGGGINLSLIVIVLLILIIAVAVIYVFLKKKQSSAGAKNIVAPKKAELKPEETKEKKKFCMFCHAPMPYDADFCPKCGKKQDDTKRFCMNCGALMPAVPELCGKCSKMPPSDMDTKNCKNCGEVIPKVARFCSACGAGQPE